MVRVQREQPCCIRARVIPARGVGGHQCIGQSMCVCRDPKSGRGSKGQGIVRKSSVAAREGAKAKEALAADKSPESGDDFTEVSRSRRTAVQRTLMARIDTVNTRAARVGRRGIGEPVSRYALMPRDWRA